MGKRPPIVYHYTNHIAFTKIIQGKQIWAHDCRLSNDSREIDYASGLMTVAIDNVSQEVGFNEYIGRVHDEVKDPFNPFKLRNDILGDLFVASFSEQPNLLSQWRAYAPENGYSIGFHTKKLGKIAEKNKFRFAKVEYDFSKAVKFFTAQLRAYINRCVASEPANEPYEDCRSRLLELMTSIIPLVKHESFEEEQEWRIFKSPDTTEDIQFYPGSRSLTPYLPIQLAQGRQIDLIEEVIIGPSDDHHTLSEWTARYLRNLGHQVRRTPKGEGIRVYVSGSPYRLRRSTH